MIRVGVPYANHGRIIQPTATSIEKLQNSHLDVEIKTVQGSNIPRARNGCVNEEKSCLKYQKVDFDYFLALDADVEFEVSDVEKLLSHNLPIIGGLYHYKREPEKAVAGFFDDKDLIDPTRPVMMNQSGLLEVDWIGAGFILIRKDVFEQTEYPWFKYEILSWEEDDNEYQSIVSDDLGFCLGMKDQGFKLYVDCDVKLKHHKHPNETPVGALNDIIYNTQHIASYISQMNQEINILRDRLKE